MTFCLFRLIFLDLFKFSLLCFYLFHKHYLTAAHLGIFTISFWSLVVRSFFTLIFTYYLYILAFLFRKRHVPQSFSSCKEKRPTNVSEWVSELCGRFFRGHVKQNKIHYNFILFYFPMQATKLDSMTNKHLLSNP